MILETTRIVADWLGREDVHRSEGVNDNLAEIPRDGGDEEPRHVRGVWDETRDKWVATRDSPPNVPALYVMQNTPFVMEGEVATHVRDAEQLELAIRYVTSDYESARAIQETDYTLRAAIRSLRELARNKNADARTRNQVSLLSFSRLTQVPVIESLEDMWVTGAILAECEIRDAAP